MDYNYHNPNNDPYNRYNPYNGGNQYGGAQSIQSSASAAMKLVYVKMALALLVTGIVSWWAGTSDAYLSFIRTNSWLAWVIFGAQFVMVIAINSAINKLSTGMGTLLFYVFAVLMALWIAPVFAIYTHTSIAKTFFITAGTFGAMSIYGYTTNADLTKFGNILFMALIGLIIASVVNIFTRSETLYWIISGAGVLIFVGLTAWDTQKIKQLAMYIPASQHGRLATIGALSLYLDFINLFLYLLQFFGRRN